ncbi:MAG TPA: hypothetical protein PKA58_33555 [Polyangium sp.]|jgi:hypothetical protein|nr:hypothetical protein [Polyangium sp.]
MQGIDAFLDTYVRIDEGTRVLLVAHRSCARTAAWLYAAIFLRGTEPVTIVFDQQDADSELAISAALDELRARPGVRRVATILCEPGGPSFAALFERRPEMKSERTPIFRITGSSSAAFDMSRRSSNHDKRGRRVVDTYFQSENSADDDYNEDEGLSDSEIDELLHQCGFEMDELDDDDIEQIAAMSDEEIGSLTDEELAALAELEDSELLQLAAGWGEDDFRVLA